MSVTFGKLSEVCVRTDKGEVRHGKPIKVLKPEVEDKSVVEDKDVGFMI